MEQTSIRQGGNERWEMPSSYCWLVTAPAVAVDDVTDYGDDDDDDDEILGNIVTTK